MVVPSTVATVVPVEVIVVLPLADVGAELEVVVAGTEVPLLEDADVEVLEAV
jgi:hypothetical protein